MNNFIDLYEKFIEIKKMGWIKSLGNGNGAIGITFEKLLGKEIENFEIPDYEGIEIKVHGPYKKGTISLFSATPDSYLFEIKRIHELYSYPDKDMPQFKIFQMPIYYNKVSHYVENFHFSLHTDKEKKQLKLLVFNQYYELIDDKTAWSFDLLIEKIERKLTNLAIIEADRKKINGIKYFKYNNINFYKFKNFDTFLSLIKNGDIGVSFKIGVYKSGKKFGQIYDHGTTFIIKKNCINKLYDNMSIDKIKGGSITC